MSLSRRFMSTIAPRYTGLNKLELVTRKKELSDMYPELDVILNNPRIHSEYDMDSIVSEFRKIHRNRYSDDGDYKLRTNGIFVVGSYPTGLLAFSAFGAFNPSVALLIAMVGGGMTFAYAGLCQTYHKENIDMTMNDYSMLLSIIREEKAFEEKSNRVKYE